ncbi:hypothetical protein IB238_24135 [Rhizobium sp. ARZ01]|uniref:nucleotidyltransferase family protein n=1 Tax=Rhizobium sp. ARZ01 TaxID=2769313 RepID=UPI00177AF636|nr:GSU2403 family nucleotidyltransferase fold protein [Rhizobium sp. ARZ01]MBD9375696.1 hypothetical protein [Rhizobium sp. ARZ01]
MRRIDMMYQTMLAEIGQRALDDAWNLDFPPTGRFVRVRVKDRDYWYFDQPDGDGGQARKYVGPADDPEIAKRVEDFSRTKTDYRTRRRLVSSLTRDGGLQPTDRASGEIVEALAAAGLFRLRAVLVGTLAFGTYSGVLGVRLPSTAMMTGDADFAQDYAISAGVMDSLPPILDLLQTMDPTFRAVPNLAGADTTAFVNKEGYRVEFLTTNRGKDEYLDKPADMPALGGASAQPLRFMDFLIREPVRTVLLYGAGVSVLVPDPARYAIHKLIVASRRHADSVLKRDKDIMQAGILTEAMLETRQSADLASAYIEAWERGPAWQEAIRAGAAMLPGERKDNLRECLYTGSRGIGEKAVLPF